MCRRTCWPSASPLHVLVTPPAAFGPSILNAACRLACPPFAVRCALLELCAAASHQRDPLARRAVHVGHKHVMPGHKTALLGWSQAMLCSSRSPEPLVWPARHTALVQSRPLSTCGTATSSTTWAAGMVSSSSLRCSAGHARACPCSRPGRPDPGCSAGDELPCTLLGPGRPAAGCPGGGEALQ